MSASATVSAFFKSPPPWARVAVRIAAWVGGAIGAALLALLLLICVSLAVAYPQLPPIESITDYRPKLPLRVFSADGVLLGEFGEERRHFVPIGVIPQVMKDAVLAAEDARFYQHGGVDFKGVLRAAVENLRESRSQGASTITMQVARNFYLSTEKTFTRKIYEILLALKIESVLSKDQILELYLNQIFLGHRAHGFAAAAEVYFGKNLDQLSVAEAAMLAGIPKAPSAYNPISNPRRATQRQRWIIDRMAANGFITENQQDEALAEKLRYRKPAEVSVHAEYIAEMARQLVFSRYGDEAYTRGLDVTLTIDSQAQDLAYRALRKGLMDFELRKPYRGPEAYIDLPANPDDIDDKVAAALVDHPDNGELRAAVVLDASRAKVTAMLQSGEQFSVSGKGLAPVASGLNPKAPPQNRILPGAVVRAVKDAAGEWTLTQVPEVEGAFVALDPRTGELRALVGGFDYDRGKFNHATQAWRQPGSSFKPFIYSAALEKGFTPMTVVNDAPLFFSAEDTGSQPWEPKNYDGHFDGPMALRTALAKSKNMVSIRVLRSIGPAYAQDWITRFGFEPERHPAYLTMALGAGTVTPLQMASAYSVFANGGHRIAPVIISKVSDNRGRTLRDVTPALPGEPERVISARNAFVMDTLLQEVARSGTAARAQAVLKRPDLYGKTGTTNDSMDAWFCGFQPTLVAVVWIGYDTPKKLGDKETGGGLSLPVWIDFMRPMLAKVPVQELTPPPEGVVNVGGNWVFQEFADSRGVVSVGLEDQLPQAPTQEEKDSILDLFKR